MSKSLSCQKNSEKCSNVIIMDNLGRTPQFCMHCGSLQERDFERCPVCNNPPPPWGEVKICKGCGTKVPKDARFCYLDGGQLEL